ncbi:uncharacterized protein LOC115695363 [Cannabis sativa]|uniref:uncharacterized protein LOC115695363 n=1 Tax=Cannabis sativa TaxID=3483 RepID=UPI0011DF390E|nr:uncharacterized protein LOC115695363 [Cannabis sativa]
MAIVVGLTILSQPWRDLKLKSIDIVQELLDGFEDFIKIKEAIKKVGSLVVLGDFNDILSNEERIAARVKFTSSKDFPNCLATCQLEDVKYGENFFTWSNKQQGKDRIYLKINRILANQAWIDEFPNAEALLLNERTIDHSPGLLKNIRGTLMYQVVSKLKGLKGIFKEINHKDDERVYGEQVAYAFLNYYQSLLGTRLENRLQVNVDIMLQGPLVTKQQADFLLSDYTLDEVNKVFFDILGLKAPEPDGYGSYFLEDNWKLVGDDISLAILSFLHFGQMLKEINNMVLTLVPKCKCPNIVGECRPIVCCLNPNPSKSAIYCSGMDDGMVQRVLRAFGFTKSQLPFKYLGIPICAKTISGIECSILVEKMIARIRSWSSRNSSYVGRTTLIGSVLVAINSYWSQIMVLIKKSSMQ